MAAGWPEGACGAPLVTSTFFGHSESPFLQLPASEVKTRSHEPEAVDHLHIRAASHECLLPNHLQSIHQCRLTTLTSHSENVYFSAYARWQARRPYGVSSVPGLDRWND